MIEKKPMKTVIALIFAAITLPASARIGETLDRCIARYGPVRRVEKGGFQVFHKSGFEIGVSFRDGKAVALGIVKQRKPGERAAEITGEEIKTVLAANGGSVEWTKLDGVTDQRWATSDGLLSACYTPLDRTLFIMTLVEVASRFASSSSSTLAMITASGSNPIFAKLAIPILSARRIRSACAAPVFSDASANVCRSSSRIRRLVGIIFIFIKGSGFGVFVINTNTLFNLRKNFNVFPCVAVVTTTTFATWPTKHQPPNRMAAATR